MTTYTDTLARFFVKPYGIVVLTVFLSWLGWALHGYTQDINVFEEPEPIFSSGGLMVLTWYSSIILVSFCFFKIGLKIKVGLDFFNRYANLQDKAPYLALTAAGALGTYACVNKIVGVLGWSGIWEAIMQQKSLIFGLIIRASYQRGPLTLRYCVIVSAGLALYRVLINRRIDFFTLFNLFILTVILIAGNVRLYVMAATVLGVGLYVLNVDVFRISILKSLLLGLIIFALLTLSNSLRNGSVYSKEAGNDSAISSNLAQISGYLGTPFQTSLAVGNKYELTKRGEDYMQLAGVIYGMTTNSVFFDSVRLYGDWAWPLIWAETAVISLIMGAVSHHHRNYMIILYLVLLYVMAEYWRGNLLGKGGFTFLILLLPIGTIMGACVNKVLGREVEIEEDEDDEDEIDEHDGIDEKDPEDDSNDDYVYKS